MGMFHWPPEKKKEPLPIPFIASGPLTENHDNGAPILYLSFAELALPVLGKQITMKAVVQDTEKHREEDAAHVSVVIALYH